MRAKHLTIDLMSGVYCCSIIQTQWNFI